MKLRSAAALSALIPLLLSGTAAHAATTSINSGSLGAGADGTNGDTVALGQPGAVAAGGDQSVGYAGGARTTIPFLSSLNPATSSPFTIEFWSMPSASDGDDAAISNRFAGASRSGWTFFQRGAGVGWNFRMYNGVGGGLAWDLTGGTSNLNVWNHVAVTWDGIAAILYVDGNLADTSNDPGASGTYNVNTALNSPIFSIGANFDGGSPSTALMDEVAFYGTALDAAQINSHFTTAFSPNPGDYQALVTSHGALLHLNNNVPEPTSGLLLGLGAVTLLWRRGRKG